MAVYTITSSSNSVKINIDNKEANFGSKDIRPYTPDRLGDVVYMYDGTGIFKKIGSSDSGTLFSNDRIKIDLSIDTVSVDGTTSFADAGALLDALSSVFFLTSSGGGNALIPEDQRVNTYADLPSASSNDGKYYVVDQPSGTWILGTRKEAGIYKSVSSSWVYRGADVPYYLLDDQFTIKDSTDNTKQLGFEVSGISTSTRRTVTWPDRNITPAGVDQLPTNQILVKQSNVSQTLGGTIDSSKLYLIDGDIDMTGVTVTVPSTGIFIAGYNLDLSILSCADNNYTMLDGGTAGNVFIQNLSLSVTGTSSQVFNLTDATGFNAVELVRVNFNDCTAIGELNGFRQGLESNTGRFGGTPEMTLSGTWLGGYFINTSIVRSLTDGAYSLFKAGTGFSMNSRFRSNQNIDLPANASFLNFSGSNFVNPSTLQIQSALVSRNGVFNAGDLNITPNIDQTNLKSSWGNNVGMPNTFEGGRLTVSSANQTNIPSGSTWVNLNAIWSVSSLEHFDSPSSGQLRHIGSSPREYKCTVNFLIESQQGNDIGIRLRKFKSASGTFQDFTERRRQVNNFVGGRDVAIFNFSFNAILNQNDYVFFQVRNNSGNQNVTLEIDSDYIIEER